MAIEHKPVKMAKKTTTKKGKAAPKPKEAIEIKIKKQALNLFPVDAFPEMIQDIIKDYYEAYRLPIDYHATSILVAASIAIGNTYAAYYKRGQVYPAMIWAAVVGFPSSGKSPAIDFGVWPLMAIEKRYREEHNVHIQNWQMQKAKSIVSGEEMEALKPKSKDLIINDATVESINVALVNNPKGLLLYQDELMGWINSMNSYRKGSDLEYYLSTWSGKSAKISRSMKEAMFIPNPFVSAIGGVQPGKITALASDGKASNGFLARILFAWPDEMEKPLESDKEPKQDSFDNYRGIIDFLNGLPNKFELPENNTQTAKVNRIEVPLSEEAFKAYIAFLDVYTGQMNDTDDEDIKATLGKLQQYCLRISLIMEMLDLACDKHPRKVEEKKEDWINKSGTDKISLGDMEKLKISLSSIEKSIQIIEYFKITALKVIQRLESPVKSLKPFQQALYESLPEDFESATAVEIGAEITRGNAKAKLSKKTVHRMLNNRRLFSKMGRGMYQKNYL